MGMNVVLYAEGQFNEYDFDAIKEQFEGCFGDHDRFGVLNTYSATLEIGNEGRRVTAETMIRYYGISYERGYWPAISAMVRFLTFHFPDCVIYYGSDAQEDFDVFTETEHEELWRNFLTGGPGDYARTGWDFNRKNHPEMYEQSKEKNK